MIVEVKNGELFAEFEKNQYFGLIHGCNCFSDMGGGFARHVRLLYPEAFDADKNSQMSPENKFGKFTHSNTENGVIINLYSQFHGGPNFDYDAYSKALTIVNEKYKGKNFCIPKIGCGIGGADWNIVEKITNEITTDINITVFDFTPINNTLY